MHQRARQVLQRVLASWDEMRRTALDIRHGDPLAARLGQLGPGSKLEYPYSLRGNVLGVEIGCRTHIRSGFRLEALAPPGATIIRVGDDCHIGHDVRLVAVNGITVESGAALGHGCTLADTVHDYKSAGTEQHTWQTGLKVGNQLTIGENAWIGNNTVVVGGITVGAGAIVNANSVINRDVPPYTLVGGNPARLWRQREPDGEWRWLVDPDTLGLDARSAQ